MFLIIILDVLNTYEGVLPVSNNIVVTNIFHSPLFFCFTFYLW